MVGILAAERLPEKEYDLPKQISVTAFNILSCPVL